MLPLPDLSCAHVSQNDVDLDTMGSKTVKSHDVFNRYDDDEDEDEDPEDSPSSFDRFDEANDAMGLLDIADDVDREV